MDISRDRLSVASDFNSTDGNNSSRIGGSTDNGSFLFSDFESLLTAVVGQSSLTQIILLVYRMFVSQLGFDPSFFLALCGCIWAVCKLGSLVSTHCSRLINRYYKCSITVSEYDPIHRHLMRWLSRQQSVNEARHLMAQTVYYNAWEKKENPEADLYRKETRDGGSTSRYVDFSKNPALSSRFIPAIGTTPCWHNNTKFFVSREKESVIATSGLSPVKEVVNVTVSCYGRSIDPIKDFLAHVSSLYCKATQDMTKIYRPQPKELRRGHHLWQEVAKRRKRPMKTVVLDEAEKERILSDIDEYLSPQAEGWYADRGIPLRRGYLFHGPPGTGKTSLAFATAGVFGLDIYLISLMDANLTEDDLAGLLSKLPPRCIVLLEDVDTAGLKRDGEQDEEVNQEESAEERRKKNAKSISLSGLLNALDGVASHEGHVLFMTTNKRESLDKALIRAGRVDIEVSFQNASKNQAEGLFSSIYEPTQQIEVQKVEEAVNEQNDKLVSDPTRQDQLVENAGGKKNDGLGDTSALQIQHDEKTEDKPTDELAKILASQKRESDMTIEEIKVLAAHFSNFIPDNIISPAEIQGFLLERKNKPLKALEDAELWIKGLIGQKKSNSNAATVQQEPNSEDSVDANSSFAAMFSPSTLVQ